MGQISIVLSVIRTFAEMLKVLLSYNRRIVMKKLSLYIFLSLIFSNFTTVLKAKKMEVFCLISISDLKNLAEEDRQRFEGMSCR